jgi:hypothetical protein
MSEDRPSFKQRLLALYRRTGLGSGTERVALREFMLVATVAVAIIVAAFWVAFRYVRPAPPDEFVISSGAPGGAYHLHARRYGELLARERIGVHARPSSGSPDNLARLVDPDSGVSVAFRGAWEIPQSTRDWSRLPPSTTSPCGFSIAATPTW